MFNPDLKKIESSVKRALEEDIGLGDVTGELIDPLKNQEAKLVCREESILCGSLWFDKAFTLLDPNLKIDWNQAEGDLIKKDALMASQDSSNDKLKLLHSQKVLHQRKFESESHTKLFEKNMVSEDILLEKKLAHDLAVIEEKR